VTTPKTVEKRPSARSKSPATRSKSPATRSKSTSRPAPRAKTPQRPAAGPRPTSPKTSPGASHGGRSLTLTVPPLSETATRAVQQVAALPVTAVRRVLPAKGGLPLYAGLGALAVVGALEWPLAVGIGVGYALLRHHGPLAPPSDSE